MRSACTPLIEERYRDVGIEEGDEGSYRGKCHCWSASFVPTPVAGVKSEKVYVDLSLAHESALAARPRAGGDHADWDALDRRLTDASGLPTVRLWVDSWHG